jgi:hypothetical protein
MTIKYEKIDGHIIYQSNHLQTDGFFIARETVNMETGRKILG